MKKYEQAFVDAVIPILMERLPPVYEDGFLPEGDWGRCGPEPIEIDGWRYTHIRRMGAIAPKGEFIEYSVKRCNGYHGEKAWLLYYPPGAKTSSPLLKKWPGWRIDSDCCFKRYKGRTHKGIRTYGYDFSSILDSYIPEK